ncbi:prostaglandin E synthase 3 isoform X2 [Venturia canescens]|uniref:prostaglandin E synthase 3 isoform X2 n=1 Tax=Venturia canescens TaxID=32260 RepID=UPI001C9D2C58|nr:prostaglandin E synthase 3 isoform X2 [Venturia canescens]
MSQENQVIPPPVIWAQRANILYVTICLEDCKDPTLEIECDKIYFKGVGGTDRKMHELTINLFKSIEPEKTVRSPKERVYELVLYKKEEGPYWPRLTKEDKKFHWLKSDFNKWRDEDDSEEDSESQPKDLESVMRDLGYLGGAKDAKPSLDDLEDNTEDATESDSDDEDLPDLE